MDPLFSEFSYGYDVTQELATGGIFGPLKGYPMFPSLKQEGQSGGGYDVMLPLMGSPLYLQFKLSHFMKRAYAENWYLFNAPYYRMYLLRSDLSMQHELLIHLELSGNEVYYIAPEFYTDDELTEHYTNKAVFHHSDLFSPSDIAHVDDDERHYVAFDDTPVAYLCSKEPRKLEKSIKGRIFSKENIPSTINKSRKINKFFFDDLIDASIKILEERMIRTDTLKQSRIMREKAETISEKASFAGFLARAYFGCELFVVGE